MLPTLHYIGVLGASLFVFLLRFLPIANRGEVSFIESALYAGALSLYRYTAIPLYRSATPRMVPFEISSSRGLVVSSRYTPLSTPRRYSGEPTFVVYLKYFLYLCSRFDI